MKKSCGYLIKCQDRFLLCHSTKPSRRISLEDGQWGIPKGGCEENETEIEAAIREVREETGINVQLYPHSKEIAHRYSTKNKHYIIFFCEIKGVDIADIELKCESFVPEVNYPENDDFVWVDWKTAEKIAVKNQKFNLFTEEVRVKLGL
jgi:8-oxo-dGTP pyrophosphatase MutT (NUDIX family)